MPFAEPRQGPSLPESGGRVVGCSGADPDRVTALCDAAVKGVYGVDIDFAANQIEMQREGYGPPTR